MTAPTTSITLLSAVPAALGDELGIAVGDRDPGDVLTFEHHDALRLVRLGLARFGSPARDAASSSIGEPPVRHGAAALDFPSISAGASAALTVAVPRAEVGEPVAVTPPAGLTAGLVAAAAVTSAGVVTVTVANTTAGALDPASGAWTVAVVNDAHA